MEEFITTEDMIGNKTRFNSDNVLAEKFISDKYTLMLSVKGDSIPPFFGALINVLDKTNIGRTLIGKSLDGYILYCKKSERNFNKRLFVSLLEPLVK